MAKFSPTPEQLVAIDAARAFQPLKVNAKAGAGKTSTLELMSAALAPKRGMYLAFNRSIAGEAAAKMPANVEARTFHSLAFRERGRAFGERLKLRLNGGVVAHRLNLHNWQATAELTMTGSMLGSLAIQTVNRFCRTLDAQITEQHVPAPDIRGIDDAAVLASIRQQIVDPARRLWALMSDPHGDFPTSHDVYVKLWATDRPRIYADFLLFDEAQDADSIMLHVCQQQDAPVFYVGDPLQQIYSRRGAINAMQTIDTPRSSILTMSFRFGQRIADAANRVTAYLGDTDPIRGNPARASELCALERPDAILCRTNATVVAELFRALREGRTSLAATGVNQAVEFYKQAKELKDGIRPSGALQLFTSWTELVDYTGTPEGSDLATYISLAEQHGIDDILAMLAGIDDAGKGCTKAELAISTAHRAKGLEWDAVRLAGDFRLPSDDEKAKQPSPEEMRLLYVAMTRARLRLDVGALDLTTLDAAAPIAEAA